MLTAPWAQAFSATVIGIAVAYIAWRQWQTARQKLALDLFDRRYQIYETVVDYYYASGWITGGKQAEEKLSNALRTARFLFDKDVYDCLMEATSVEDGGTMRWELLGRAFSLMEDYMSFHEPMSRRRRGAKRSEWWSWFIRWA